VQHHLRQVYRFPLQGRQTSGKAAATLGQACA
jgi:hypothetical protein